MPNAIYNLLNLLIGVELKVAKVDVVYKANDPAHVETTRISAQTHFKLATGMRVDVCATKALPLGVNETGAAV